jgi:nitroimidazol reductase NimA-like FMN-containing flavoprotein (pyridoxamine 5'-phosphate oxidase superfamily)
MGSPNEDNGSNDSKVLSVHDCWEALRSASVGRLAVVNNGAPDIFPVNYLPEDGTVVFRTGPGAKIDALAAGGPVALEADGLNTYGTIAWSVVLKGNAEILDVSGDELMLARGPSPWEEGKKDKLVRITPDEISGRRFVVTSSPTYWWQPRDPTAANHPNIQ